MPGHSDGGVLGRLCAGLPSRLRDGSAERFDGVNRRPGP